MERKEVEVKGIFKVILHITPAVMLLLGFPGCGDGGGKCVECETDLLDASDVGSPDSDSLADVVLDAGVIPIETICSLQESQYSFISGMSCGVPLSQPWEDSTLYKLSQLMDTGLVLTSDLCGSSPIDWYPDDLAKPSNIVACPITCDRTRILFPAFISVIKPYLGCDARTNEMNVGGPDFLCREEQFLFMSEISCIIPITQPVDSSPIYQSLQLLDGGIVSSANLCNSNPFAWYPNDPANPTIMIACSQECFQTMVLFPAFIALIKSFLSLDCDTATDGS